MELKETDLTPELAAQLLASPHPSQRRPARATVQAYARAIREGRWVLVPDALLVDEEGRMFNGAHRCAAVIETRRSIPVYILWGADPALFDVIDVGRRRSAYQFVHDTDASIRAGAARMTLWYARRFERPPVAPNVYFDMQELLAEVDARKVSFDFAIPLSRKTYEYTSIPTSIAGAAYAIAHDFGQGAEVEAFVEGVSDPAYLPPGDPARLLADRYRRTTHRSRRRPATEDWTLLVRALNLHFEDKVVGKLSLSEVWPRVSESDADYNRRIKAASMARKRGTQRAELHAKTA